MKDFLGGIEEYMESNATEMIPLFIIGIALWFCFVIFMLSRFGWSKFTYKYESEPPTDLVKIGITSAKVGWVSYNNSLTISYNKAGLFIKPLLIFKLGHRPLFIPFKDIVKEEEQSTLGIKSMKLHFRDENIPTLTLQHKIWSKIKVAIA